MGMEDIMKALMQSAEQPQGQASAERGLGSDLLSGVLGGLMGGGQQQMPQQSGGGDMLGMLGSLMGGGQQSMPQQQSMQPQAGGDMMGMLGSLLGGAQQPMQQQPVQQPASSGDMMLGMLEQLIGGQPGQGQLGVSPMSSMNMGAVNNPIMGLLQPIVNQVAGKLGISPQIATVVASIAMHYLLSSHSSTSPQAPMNLGSIMQQLGRSGSLSQGTLRNSGMVQDVMQATGLNKQEALRSLDATFGVLGSQVQGMAG
jgi:hypothetical protein